MSVNGNLNVSSVPSGKGAYGWEAYVFLHGFLMLLENALHLLLNLTSPHHKTAVTYFGQGV